MATPTGRGDDARRETFLAAGYSEEDVRRFEAAERDVIAGIYYSASTGRR